MTGPSSDADVDEVLDEALGVSELPPAVVTDRHLAEAGQALSGHMGFAVGMPLRQSVAQALADAEVHAVARYIAERAAAGTL